MYVHVTALLNLSLSLSLSASLSLAARKSPLLLYICTLYIYRVSACPLSDAMPEAHCGSGFVSTYIIHIYIIPRCKCNCKCKGRKEAGYRGHRGHQAMARQGKLREEKIKIKRERKRKNGWSGVSAWLCYVCVRGEGGGEKYLRRSQPSSSCLVTPNVEYVE